MWSPCSLIPGGSALLLLVSPGRPEPSLSLSELCLDWRCLKGGGDQCDSEVGRVVSSEVCGGVARYTDNQHWAGGGREGETR